MLKTQIYVRFDIPLNAQKKDGGVGGEGETKVTYTDIYFKNNNVLQIKNNAVKSVASEEQGLFSLCARMFRRKIKCTCRRAAKSCRSKALAIMH